MKNKTNGMIWFFHIFFGIFYIVTIKSFISYLNTSNREHLHVAIIFFIVFPGIHFLLNKLFTSVDKREELIKKNKDTPWRWRDDWKRRKANPDSAQKVLFYVSLGLGILFTVIGVLIISGNEFQYKLRREDYKILVVCFFPVVGVYSLFQSIKHYLKLKRFKGSHISFDSDYGVLGSFFRGKFVTPFSFPAGTRFEFKISCVKVYEVKRGKETRQHRTELWSRTWIGKKLYQIPYTEVPIEIEIPKDLPETLPLQTFLDHDNPINFFGKKVPKRSRRGIEWKITIVDKLPEVDFDYSFEIPICKGVGTEHSVYTKAEALSDEVENLQRPEYFTTSHEDGYLNYIFNTSKANKASIVVCLFGIAFFSPGVGVLIYTFSNTLGVVSIFQIFMGTVFTLIGLLVFVLGVLTISFSQKITLGIDHLIYSNLSLFGLKEKRIFLNEVKSVKLESRYSSGTTKFYDILLFRQENQIEKLHKLAIKIPSEVEAQYLVQKLFPDLVI